MGTKSKELLEAKVKLGLLVPGTEEWNRLLNTDWPDYKITEQTRELAMTNVLKYRSSARLAMGKVYTDEEYEARREKILSIPLP